MAETYKIIKDMAGRDAIEVTDTIQNKRTIDKQSIIDEIARLQNLLAQFNNP